MALGTLFSQSAYATSDVRMPTTEDIQSHIAEYQAFFNVDLAHVSVVHENNFWSNRGPIVVSRSTSKRTCKVLIDTSHSEVPKVLDFLAKAPTQEIARRFAAAHELTHCLLPGSKARARLGEMGIQASGRIHYEEVIADILGAIFAIRGLDDPDAVLSWLRRERSEQSHFHAQYRTAEHLNLETLNKISEQMLLEEGKPRGSNTGAP